MDQNEQRKQLGAFIRSRRERLASSEPRQRKRTPGLRREELAARAGIGVTWIAWLEQGREIRASAESLARLADALSLTRAERTYLFTLAARRDPSDPFAAHPAEVPGSIAALTAALAWPAYGLDGMWNVCAANDAARRLFVGLFERESMPNFLRYVFTNPAARDLLPDWAVRAVRILAEFRVDYVRHHADPRVEAAVRWLRENSAEFCSAWQQQSVAEREGGHREFHHSELGPLSFVQHTLAAVERPDFKLIALVPADKR
jgi:transcriptional regulator with XRE-family HTH domain